MKNKSIFIIFFLIILLPSCNVEFEQDDSIDTRVNKVKDSIVGDIDKFNNKYTEVKEQIISAKDNFDNKVNQIKDTAEKMKQAGESIKGAIDSVNQVTNAIGNVGSFPDKTVSTSNVSSGFNAESLAFNNSIKYKDIVDIEKFKYDLVQFIDSSELSSEQKQTLIKQLEVSNSKEEVKLVLDTMLDQMFNK